MTNRKVPCYEVQTDFAFEVPYYPHPNLIRISGSPENTHNSFASKIFAVSSHKYLFEFEQDCFIVVSRPNGMFGPEADSISDSEVPLHLLQIPQSAISTPKLAGMDEEDAAPTQRISSRKTFKIARTENFAQFPNSKFHYRGSSFGNASQVCYRPTEHCENLYENSREELTESPGIEVKELAQNFLNGLYTRSIHSYKSTLASENVLNPDCLIQEAHGNNVSDSYEAFADQLKQIESKELQSSFASDKLREEHWKNPRIEGLQEEFTGYYGTGVDPSDFMEKIEIFENRGAEGSPQTATELVNEVAEFPQSYKESVGEPKAIEELVSEVKDIKTKVKGIQSNEKLAEAMELVKQSNEYVRIQYEENKTKLTTLREKYTKVKDSLKVAEIDALNSNKLLLKIYEAFIANDDARVLDSMNDIEKHLQDKGLVRNGKSALKEYNVAKKGNVQKQTKLSKFITPQQNKQMASLSTGKGKYNESYNYSNLFKAGGIHKEESAHKVEIQDKLHSKVSAFAARHQPAKHESNRIQEMVEKSLRKYISEE